ncbi:hypothetical protein LTR49_028265 [Elasticomyces elasticus]|nr:hypothetical protein LTR49_028265 [Elasticomyces elasticus]
MLKDVTLLNTVWWTTFTLVVTTFLCLGFGRKGVLVGSAAAGFQARMYRGFTPGGGLFATFTMLGMAGLLTPVVAGTGAIVASLVTWTVSLTQ